MYFRAGREGSWIKDREPESPAHAMSVLQQHSHSPLVGSGAVGGTTPLCALLVRSRAAQQNSTKWETQLTVILSSRTAITIRLLLPKQIPLNQLTRLCVISFWKQASVSMCITSMSNLGGNSAAFTLIKSSVRLQTYLGLNYMIKLP